MYLLPVLLDGLSTGLLLQFAVGPVFFFLLNLSLQRTIIDGFAAVVAVTIVDYLYIALAVLGVGKLLEKKNIARMFGIVSSFVLIFFGVMMIRSGIGNAPGPMACNKETTDMANSFLSAFMLTIANPLTIVFWTTLFATKAIERNYRKNQLICFGLAAGLATVLFLGSAVSVFSILKTKIPTTYVIVTNVIVGIVLIAYATLRLAKAFKNGI